MSDEKRRILEMLERGTITQEDAARLLDALGETLEDSSEPTPSFQWEEDPDQGVTVGQVMEEAQQAIQDAAQEAREAIDLAHQMGKEVARSVGEIFPKGENTSFSMNLDTPLPLEENAYPEPDILDPITEVRVEWVNGPIEIRRWDGNTIRVAEYAKRPLKDRERMETTLKNGVLRIRWTRETTFHGKLFLQKHLVVELPRELPELKQFRLETVSGEVRICGIQAGVLPFKHGIRHVGRPKLERGGNPGRICFRPGGPDRSFRPKAQSGQHLRSGIFGWYWGGGTPWGNRFRRFVGKGKWREHIPDYGIRIPEA